MTLSRAGFLKICGAALLRPQLEACLWLAVVDPAGDAAMPERSLVRFSLEDARPAHFRPCVGTTFSVRPTEGAVVPLVLAGVVEPPGGRCPDQFSLIFHAPRDTGALHGTYPIEHGGLGTFELFVAPIGPRAELAVYEACFSGPPASAGSWTRTIGLGR